VLFQTIYWGDAVRRLSATRSEATKSRKLVCWSEVLRYVLLQGNNGLTRSPAGFLTIICWFNPITSIGLKYLIRYPLVATWFGDGLIERHKLNR